MPYDDNSRIKWLTTMIARYGSEKAVREEMVRRKRKQGQTSFTGGFASDKTGRDGMTGKERASYYGSKRSTRKTSSNN